MKDQKYFVGLDIGTNSVGYAVAGEDYSLCKFHGEPMWGVTLFDEAQPAVQRRSFRTARRRLDRRQQRVRLVRELFAREISKIDEGFFKRISESYLFPESAEDKVRLFETYEAQKDHDTRYPTIHHLISELMNDRSEHDVRLVYIACAWLVAHRGHFLSEVDRDNVEAVTDLSTLYNDLAEFITRDGEYPLPWADDIDLSAVSDALKLKNGINKKAKALGIALFGADGAPKTIGERYEFNYQLVIKLLCGGKVSLDALFGKEEYADLDADSISLDSDDETLAATMQALDDDDAELIRKLKQIYDWSVLVDVLGGRQTISEAKVDVYYRHQRDLCDLKSIVRSYLPTKKYKEIFRSVTQPGNYSSYIGHSTAWHNKRDPEKRTTQDEFCKYIRSALAIVNVDECDREWFDSILARLENNTFMPRQVDGDNRVIPYQLYYYELKKVLENAASYLPFLSQADADGITVTEKLLAIFEFRIPYYVGPLKEESDKKLNHWMVRRAEGEIYPWNFDEMVDLDASEEAFIKRMTNRCTYLPGEDVLPKCSLVYSAFEVLNEINNIKINGNDIPVEAKQSIYNNVFMHHAKVTPKRIADHLRANNYMQDGDTISGLDITVKSSLRPHIQFAALIRSGALTTADAESIIQRATYAEDGTRYTKWLRKNYATLPEGDLKYLSGLKFKDFGRLSRKLLCGIEGAVDPNTGEYMTILRAMWETNNNLMQLMSDRFDFKANIDQKVMEYYGSNDRGITAEIEDLGLSNPVKRPLIRTLDILKDIVKIQKHAPERIFIEMARGTKDAQKGKRTTTRIQQIKDLYQKIKDDDIPKLEAELEGLGDMADNKLQSDKLFLYFIQLGRCLYTGDKIDIQSVLSGDGRYNIEHIYPRSFVKDDSITNNEILVDSRVNGDKTDKYPIDAAIREKMSGRWLHLKKCGLLGEEKFKRLTRSTAFTNEERFEFINRQLVETRQSTKAVASLLKKLYPDTEVVYVKAGLVSDFRQEFELLKSRDVNDLHHAKDAYLNIVAGNVWHLKFSRQFWRPELKYNAKPGVVFTHPVVCGSQTVWRGAADVARVRAITQKNAVHMTSYTYCRHSGQNGGFFDQNIVRAAAGLVPIKKGRPTEIYGGYNKPTATFFVPVKYRAGKKQDLIIMPVELLHAERFMTDQTFAMEYTLATISGITNKTPDNVEFPLGKRIIKINTVLSLDGYRARITGKAAGGKKLRISCFTPFKTGPENERYIKRLASFVEKTKKNESIKASEKYDGISKEKNLVLYDIFISKLGTAPYKYRPNNPLPTLQAGRDKFTELEAGEQAKVLLSVLGLFGRAISADLVAIGGKPMVGASTLSSSLSNWKKCYKDVRLIDQSASGLYEKIGDCNLLELL